jgi:uncharacterized repeat protein (TIGR03987 family)
MSTSNKKRATRSEQREASNGHQENHYFIRIFSCKFVLPLIKRSATGFQMSTPLIFSTVLITLALAFYSMGVWAERVARYLKKWHLVAFWIGFLFDTSGTYAMHKIANGPLNLMEPHTLTGQIAIWLMLAHAIWATIVVYREKEEAKAHFHRYSIIVWLIWLIPYFGGMYMGMGR